MMSPFSFARARFLHAFDARHVDSHGFFHEAVFSLLHRIGEMQRPKVRRGGKDHHVDARVDHVLVDVEVRRGAGKHAIGVNHDAFADLRIFLETLQARLSAVGERIANGRENYILVGP